MKKVLAIILSAVLLCTTAVAFAGCGGSETKAITGADDLKGAIIGVQSGTTGDELATEYEADGSTVNRYSKGADAVAALKNGKVDCVIIDSEPAKAFVEANDGLEILSEPLAQEEYAICMAKDKTDLLDKFNTALEELKNDGTLSNIVNNYIGSTEKLFHERVV